MNFHTVVPYIELLIKNGLAERLDGKHPRWRTTARGGGGAAAHAGTREADAGYGSGGGRDCCRIMRSKRLQDSFCYYHYQRRS